MGCLPTAVAGRNSPITTSNSTLRAILDEIAVLGNTIEVKPLPAPILLQAVRILLEESLRTAHPNDQLEAINKFVSFIAL